MSLPWLDIVIWGAITNKAVFYSTMVRHQWIPIFETVKREREQEREYEREREKEREREREI